MSEAALAKIQKDCTKLESELAIYRNSQPISASCEAIVAFTVAQSEPFSQNRSESNPWHTSSGGGGGCIVS